MAQRFSKQFIQGLGAGMDQATDPSLVENNESPFLLNVTLDQPGTWSGRKGTSSLSTQLDATDEGWGLFSYNPTTSNTNDLKAISDRDLFSWNGTTWDEDDTDEFPADTRVSGVNFLNRLYVNDASGDNPMKYVTTGAVTAVQPSGDTNYHIGTDIIEVAKNSLITQINDLQPQIIAYSLPFTDRFYDSTGTVASDADTNGTGTVVTTAAVFEPEDIGAILYNSDTDEMFRITEWTSATIPYVTTDGDTSGWGNDTIYVIRNIFEQDGAVTGIRAYGENVVSFDEQNMYVWDPTSPTWSRLFNGFGCVNGRTPQVVDGVLIWANREGIYLWGGEGRPIDVTAKIRNRVTGEGIWDLVNPDEFGNFCAGVQRAEGKYYLSVGTLQTLSGAPASATSNAVLVFDVKKGSWTIRSYPEQILDFTEHIDGNGNKDLYAITENALVVKIDDGSTDAAVAGAAGITYQIQTPHYVFGDPTTLTNIAEYYVKHVSSNNVTLKLSVNRAAYGSPITMTASSTVKVSPVLPRDNHQGFSHSLEFSGTVGTRLTIEALGFTYSDEGTLRVDRE